MTSDRPAIERLREYLQDLSPAARAMLIAELEGAMLRGEDDAGNELVLEELRGVIRGESRPGARTGQAARGGRAPGGELVVGGWRVFFGGEGGPAPGFGDAARCFFLPVEPFLIDGPAD